MKNEYNNFVPSDSLVSFYINAILEALRVAKNSPNCDKNLVKELDRQELKSQEELKTVLFNELCGVISMYASRGRAKGLAEVQLTQGDSFMPDVREMIVKNIMVMPKDYQAFFVNLERGLYSHILSGGIFSADWGRMFLKKEGLFLELALPKPSIYPPKEKAKLIRFE